MAVGGSAGGATIVMSDGNLVVSLVSADPAAVEATLAWGQQAAPGQRPAPAVLIESWLTVAALGIESRRESAPIPGQFPKLKTLHVWWARRPLAASAGAVLGSLMPAWSPELAGAFQDAPELRAEAA